MTIVICQSGLKYHFYHPDFVLVICSFDTADEVVTSIDPQKVEILQRYMLETCIVMYMVIDSQDFMMR